MATPEDGPNSRGTEAIREMWPDLARPAGLEPATPGLEGPSSVTLKKWPDFEGFQSPIGYDIAVINLRITRSPVRSKAAKIRRFSGRSDQKVITDRRPTIEFAPDFERSWPERAASCCERPLTSKEGTVPPMAGLIGPTSIRESARLGVHPRRGRQRRCQGRAAFGAHETEDDLHMSSPRPANAMPNMTPDHTNRVFAPGITVPRMPVSVEHTNVTGTQPRSRVTRQALKLSITTPHAIINAPSGYRSAVVINRFALTVVMPTRANARPATPHGPRRFPRCEKKARSPTARATSMVT